MIEKLAITASGTGIGHTIIRRSLDAGKPTPESKEVKEEKSLEEERKKVLPIYGSQGKIIEYDKYGRHLDVFA